MLEFVIGCGAEASITNHLRDSPLDVQKYKVVQFFSCRKVEITRTANFIDFIL